MQSFRRIRDFLRGPHKIDGKPVQNRKKTGLVRAASGVVMRAEDKTSRHRVREGEVYHLFLWALCASVFKLHCCWDHRDWPGWASTKSEGSGAAIG